MPPKRKRAPQFGGFEFQEHRNDWGPNGDFIDFIQPAVGSQPAATFIPNPFIGPERASPSQDYTWDAVEQAPVYAAELAPLHEYDAGDEAGDEPGFEVLEDEPNQNAGDRRGAVSERADSFGDAAASQLDESDDSSDGGFGDDLGVPASPSSPSGIDTIDIEFSDDGEILIKRVVQALFEWYLALWLGRGAVYDLPIENQTSSPAMTIVPSLMARVVIHLQKIRNTFAVIKADKQLRKYPTVIDAQHLTITADLLVQIINYTKTPLPTQFEATSRQFTSWIAAILFIVLIEQPVARAHMFTAFVHHEMRPKIRIARVPRVPGPERVPEYYEKVRELYIDCAAEYVQAIEKLDESVALGNRPSDDAATANIVLPPLRGEIDEYPANPLDQIDPTVVALRLKGTFFLYDDLPYGAPDLYPYQLLRWFVEIEQNGVASSINAAGAIAREAAPGLRVNSEWLFHSMKLYCYVERLIWALERLGGKRLIHVELMKLLLVDGSGTVAQQGTAFKEAANDMVDVRVRWGGMSQRVIRALRDFAMGLWDVVYYRLALLRDKAYTEEARDRLIEVIDSFAPLYQLDLLLRRFHKPNITGNRSGLPFVLICEGSALCIGARGLQYMQLFEESVRNVLIGRKVDVNTLRVDLENLFFAMREKIAVNRGDPDPPHSYSARNAREDSLDRDANF